MKHGSIFSLLLICCHSYYNSRLELKTQVFVDTGESVGHPPHTGAIQKPCRGSLHSDFASQKSVKENHPKIVESKLHPLSGPENQATE